MSGTFGGDHKDVYRRWRNYLPKVDIETVGKGERLTLPKVGFHFLFVDFGSPLSDTVPKVTPTPSTYATVALTL
jgi:hypothetical protein